MVITGYRIKSQNIGDVTMELDVVKKRLKKMVNKNYHELLGEEIAFLVDNISTNAIQRNPDTTIYDDAVQILISKSTMQRKQQHQQNIIFLFMLIFSLLEIIHILRQYVQIGLI